MRRNLRLERLRRPFWRWYVWAVYPDGFRHPLTRSGFWTQLGALLFAREAQLWRDAAGYRDRWGYEVRRHHR